MLRTCLNNYKQTGINKKNDADNTNLGSRQLVVVMDKNIINDNQEINSTHNDQDQQKVCRSKTKNLKLCIRKLSSNKSLISEELPLDCK